MKRVVITGLGAVTPIGNTVTDFWKNLMAGKSGAAPITRFDTTNFKTHFACEVKDFDPLLYMAKNEVRKTDLSAQYAYAVVDECVKDSGIDFAKCDVDRIGVIWGSGIGGIKTLEEEIRAYQVEQKPRFSPFFIIKMIPNMTAGLISIRYGLRGVTFATVSACSSSNHALAEAFNLIRLGYADAIFAGGSEAAITEASIGGFNSIKALSERNDAPEIASRPFDLNRDGFVMGEGGGVLLIEDLEHALKRGAKIYCEIASVGYASDAYHVTATHPDGLGAQIAMRNALKDAALQPSEIDYINAHATSTSIGDISECKAIEAVFGDDLDKVHVGGTKSMTGHLLGAAGAIESIACVLAIQNNSLPPTINLEKVDEKINSAIQLTRSKAIYKDVNATLNNTFGFGGHIAVSLFKRYK
jgi:3-oxoacyl-[acyl-carrier-protein] synthase II